jgi:hypothetical protein
MRIQNSIKIYAKVVIILVTVCFNSCDYLDVVPPEQANTDDMMIDDQTTLRNLYACYGYLQNGSLEFVVFPRSMRKTTIPKRRCSKQ